MNIVDVLAILPYFVELVMEQDAASGLELNTEPTEISFNLTVHDDDALEEEEVEEDNLQGLLQVFRVFKLARIFKLAR